MKKPTKSYPFSIAQFKIFFLHIPTYLFNFAFLCTGTFRIVWELKYLDIPITFYEENQKPRLMNLDAALIKSALMFTITYCESTFGVTLKNICARYIQ